MRIIDWTQKSSNSSLILNVGNWMFNCHWSVSWVRLRQAWLTMRFSVFLSDLVHDHQGLRSQSNFPTLAFVLLLKIYTVFILQITNPKWHVCIKKSAKRSTHMVQLKTNSNNQSCKQLLSVCGFHTVYWFVFQRKADPSSWSQMSSQSKKKTMTPYSSVSDIWGEWCLMKVSFLSSPIKTKNTYQSVSVGAQYQKALGMLFERDEQGEEPR